MNNALREAEELGNNKRLCKLNFFKTSISNLKPASLREPRRLVGKGDFLASHLD